MEDYIIETCRYCGNRGLLKKAVQYVQELYDYCDEEPCAKMNYDWFLLECPVCKGITLFQRFSGDYTMDSQGNVKFEDAIVYPSNNAYPNTPYEIVKTYEAAVKSSKVDNEIALIAIRALLEKICKDKGAKGRNLKEKLKDMVRKNYFPATLNDCGEIIREMGNKGAHGDECNKISNRDIAELIDFVETIMFYIYELPVKIDSFNKKYELKDHSET